MPLISYTCSKPKISQNSISNFYCAILMSKNRLKTQIRFSYYYFHWALILIFTLVKAKQISNYLKNNFIWIIIEVFWDFLFDLARFIANWKLSVYNVMSWGFLFLSVSIWFSKLFEIARTRNEQLFFSIAKSIFEHSRFGWIFGRFF